MTKIAIVYHSKDGHTKVIAEHVAIGVGHENAILMDATNPDFELLNEVSGIIFGAPTYLGSVSAEFKKFMDETSYIWLKQLWRDKIAAGFTNSNALSGDKLSTLIQLNIFAMQHAMIWVGLDIQAGVFSSKVPDKPLNRVGSWLGLMTQSNCDEAPEVSPPACDKETAELFGKRIYNITKRMRSENADDNN